MWIFGGSQRAVDTYDEASLGACKLKRLDRGEIALRISHADLKCATYDTRALRMFISFLEIKYSGGRRGPGSVHAQLLVTHTGCICFS